MESSNSSFHVSLNSTLESIDIPGLVVNQKALEISSEHQHSSNNDRNSLIENIIRIYLKHPTSLDCLSDWVKVLNTRLEDCIKLPQGKVQLMKLFRENRNTTDIFFYVKCDTCQKNTKVQSDKKLGLKCMHCDELLKTDETNFFVILPIEKQIVKSIESNWIEISNFDTTSGAELKCYSDAHDGAILKAILELYKESEINILSLCINVDGANKFKSNSHSVWPIQLLQNFLPPHIRFLPQNIILNGLYYHKCTEDKPLSFHQYLRPLIDELNTWKETPISIEIGEDNYKFKPLITHCAVDLPAKSKIQETKQFGGYNACTYCEIPGERVLVKKSKIKKNSEKSENPKFNEKSVSGQNQSQHFVRYVENGCSHKSRGEIETLEKMLAASEFNGKESIDGIKDVSCLVGLEHFNIIWSVGVEYMHCVLQGVGKRLLQLFTNPKYSNTDHYIAPARRATLNKKLLQIRPTSSIVRKPRSLKQLSDWKASEHRSMLLYYLPVCLPGCLPHVYVKHVRLLSAALYILLKKSIPYDEVDRAEEMLRSFVTEHQNLFGRDQMVMVSHLLKHLAESVRQLGPLWCHSAFPFERNNGCLLKLVIGTTDVMHQISSKYCLAQSINTQNKAVTVKDETILLGKAEYIKETAFRVFDISSLEIINLENVTLSVHKRIRYERVTYTSTRYTRPKRSIDYFIGLKCGIVGKAKYYFRFQDKICVMLRVFEITDNIHHIRKVFRKDRLIIADVDEIEKKFLLMNVGLNTYITCRPNPYENE